MKWIPVSTRWPQIVPFEIQMTEVELQENLGLELDQMTAFRDEPLFRLEP